MCEKCKNIGILNTGLCEYKICNCDAGKEIAKEIKNNDQYKLQDTFYLRKEYATA